MNTSVFFFMFWHFLYVDFSLSQKKNLVGRELGHGLGSLGNGVLGELTRKSKSDSGLNLSAGQGLLLVVSGEFTGLGAYTLEDIIDERVHDRHTALGDTGLRVNLLQHTVDVRGVGLLALSTTGGGALLGALSGFLGRCLCHFELN